jgi:hypothetical protein
VIVHRLLSGGNLRSEEIVGASGHAAYIDEHIAVPSRSPSLPGFGYSSITVKAFKELTGKTPFDYIRRCACRRRRLIEYRKTKVIDSRLLRVRLHEGCTKAFFRQFGLPRGICPAETTDPLFIPFRACDFRHSMRWRKTCVGKKDLSRFVQVIERPAASDGGEASRRRVFRYCERSARCRGMLTSVARACYEPFGMGCRRACAGRAPRSMYRVEMP